MIHPLADCMNKNVPESTRVWQFSVIFPNCKIGEHCNICANVLIENDVVIGNHVTIKSGVQVWDGVRLEDNVFVGPNVTFTNDIFPRSGNNSTIIPGITIGANAMIGAGGVVTKDIPEGELWLGNPARFIRKI